ncbi:hypothetical protein [Streptomyces sp. NPDC093111]|uniref:hypothetical protein n=1 Tax=Streptomyces sp. NPDC093111 TaxID=3154978 RepID=UPI003448E262
MNNALVPAPLPEHGRITDPLWRRLWNAYDEVIGALRRIPLHVDVETTGGEFGIVAELADGSHLWIASDHDLPLDPTDLQGFHVRRAHPDVPTIDEIVYDSTPAGEQSGNGNDVAPVIVAITEFIAAQGLATPPVEVFSVQTVGVTAKHRAVVDLGPESYLKREEALKAFDQATHFIEREGARLIHLTGEDTDWPVTVWDVHGEVVTIFLAHGRQAPSQATPGRPADAEPSPS